MIPFQSQIISALGGLLLGAWITASVLGLKHDHEMDQLKIASQAVKEKATEVVIQKTQAATTITVDNTAQLQKDLTDANTKISTLQRGIANGTIGMRVNVIRDPSPGVQSSPDTTAVREVVSAELDRSTAEALIDITSTGDQYAIKYNGLRAWCEDQLTNQRK